MFVCVSGKKRTRERKINFCLSLSPWMLITLLHSHPAAMATVIKSEHQPYKAFISCCPLAAYRLSVYINCAMETSQSPAATCHFNKRSHPTQFHDHLHSRGGERQAVFVLINSQITGLKTVFGSQRCWSIKMSREHGEWHMNKLTTERNNSPESVLRD